MSNADDFDAIPVAGTQSGVSKSIADDFDSVPIKTPVSSQYSPAGTDFENFMAGAGKAVVDLGRGAKQLIDEPAVWLESKFPGLASWGAAHGFPTATQSSALTNADVAESRRLDQPLMGTTAGVAGNIGGNIASTMIPLGAGAAAGSKLAGAMLNPMTYRAAIGTGAAMGALQPTIEGESKITNAVLGGAAGAVGNFAANTIGRIAQPVQTVLSAAHDKAVSTLESAGIPLDAAQKSGSTFLGKLRSSFFDNPFTAGAESQLASTQKAGFNRAVLSTIGEDATAATPDVMGAAEKRINGVFSDVLNRNNVGLSDDILSKIGTVQSNASIEEKQPIVRMADRIVNSVGDDGTIPGQVAYGIKKDLDRLGSSQDTTLAYHARQLRSTLMDAIGESLPPGDNEAFNEARTQFAKMKTIEPAIDKMGNGDISPSRLANIMGQKANRQFSVYGKGDQDLVDLAHAGNMLLPDRNPNSGTVARAVMQLAVPLGAGIGQGAYTGDWEEAAKTAATVAAIPKAAQWMMNSPAVSNYLARGIAGGAVRNVLESPQTSPLVGGVLRRLPEIYTEQQKALQPALGNIQNR
jgi:hypothetical protein